MIGLFGFSEVLRNLAAFRGDGGPAVAAGPPRHRRVLRAPSLPPWRAVFGGTLPFLWTRRARHLWPR